MAKLYGRLRPLGLTLGEIETVFNGFNTAAALTGATAAESSGALLQLSQALGAGALRGEEFNSVAEQAPGVIAAIGAELKVPIGQLKNLAKEGKITSAVLIRALKRVETEGTDRLSEALNTPAQKFKLLQNRVEDLNVALGKLILPAVLSFLDLLTGKVTALTGEVNKTSRALAKVNQLLQQFKILSGDSATAGKQIENMFNFAAKAAFDFVASLIPGIRALDLFLKLRDRLAGKEGPKKVRYPKASEYPDLSSLDDRLGFDPPGSDDKDKGSKRESQVPQLQAELQLAKALFDIDQKIRAAELDGNRLRVERLQAERIGVELAGEIAQINLEQIPEAEKLLKIDIARVAANEELGVLAAEQLQAQQDRAQAAADALRPIEDEIKLLKGRLNGDEARVQREMDIRDLTDERLGITREMATALVDERNGLQELVKQAEFLEGIFAEVAQQIQAALVDTITSAIDGSKDLQAIWADTLKSIGRFLINAGIGQLGGGLGIPGFADGGLAPANKPAMVGERGPEIIVPATPGLVIPNDPFKDAAAAISSPAGTTADPFAATEAVMGSAAQVMQAEAAERQASAMAQSDSNMTIQTQVINSVEYATVEQVQAASTAAAKNARARVFGELKNSPSRRGGIGL